MKVKDANNSILSKPICLLGLVSALILLAGQAVYFEGRTLSRDPALRPILESVCKQIDCRLPVYRNVQELTVLNSGLTLLPARNQLFEATVQNRAAFAQPYPNLELVLLDYAGNPFSSRVFRPDEYSEEPLPRSSLMPAGANLRITLNIAEPKQTVGGYTFEFIE